MATMTARTVQVIRCPNLEDTRLVRFFVLIAFTSALLGSRSGSTLCLSVSQTSSYRKPSLNQVFILFIKSFTVKSEVVDFLNQANSTFNFSKKDILNAMFFRIHANNLCIFLNRHKATYPPFDFIGVTMEIMPDVVVLRSTDLEIRCKTS